MKFDIVRECFPVRRKVRWYPWRPNDGNYSDWTNIFSSFFISGKKSP